MPIKDGYEKRSQSRKDDWDSDRERSLNPTPAPKSKYQSKDSTDDKMYGSGKSMSERFRNFVTGGASDTLKKATK